MLKSEFAVYAVVLPVIALIVLLILHNILGARETSSQSGPNLLDKLFALPGPAVGVIIILPFLLIYGMTKM